jgi:hypothetical protein
MEKDITQEERVITSGQRFGVANQSVGSKERIRTIRVWSANLKNGLGEKSPHGYRATRRWVGRKNSRREFEFRLTRQRLCIQKTQFPRVLIFACSKSLDGTAQKRFGAAPVTAFAKFLRLYDRGALGCRRPRTD